MTKNEIKKSLLKEIKKTIDLGNSIYSDKKIPFDNIDIRFTLRGTTAGRARYVNDKNVTLWFHPELAKRDVTTYVAQTVKHEIAHLYQYKLYPRSKPHGYEFRMIARKLGDDGSRCHSLNTKGLKQERALKRYVYECPICERKSNLTKGKHDKQKRYIKYDPSGNSGYICSKCNKRLWWTHKIREYSNITGDVMAQYTAY